MSFTAILTAIPLAIKAIDALDDLVINGWQALDSDQLDPNDLEDLMELMAKRQESKRKRDEALDSLQKKIEEVRARSG